MTFNQLKIFDAFAKSRNLTVAAKELHVSQPAVSHQIKLLENECRTKFYERVGNRVRLTEQGESFLSSARNVLSEIERLEEKFKPEKAPAGVESLSVGGSLGPSAVLLPALLALFKRRYPKVQLILRTHDSRWIEELVVKSDVEIAVVTTPSDDPHLVVEPFRREKTVIFASTKHPLARKRVLRLHDLASVPLIVRDARRIDQDIGTSGHILRQLKSGGRKPNVIMRCEYSDSVKTQVRMGLGLGILDEDMVQPDLRAGDLKVLKVSGLDIGGQSFIIYRKNTPLSVQAYNFLVLLRRARRNKRFSANVPFISPRAAEPSSGLASPHR